MRASVCKDLFVLCACESCKCVWVCVCVFVCVCAFPVRVAGISVGLSIYISVYVSVHCDGRLLCALCHALFLYFPRSFFPNLTFPLSSLCSLSPLFLPTFAFVFHISLFLQQLAQFIVCRTHWQGAANDLPTLVHIHSTQTHTYTLAPPSSIRMIITPGVASINKSEVNFAMCLARKCLVNRAMATGQKGQPDEQGKRRTDGERQPD